MCAYVTCEPNSRLERSSFGDAVDERAWEELLMASLAFLFSFSCAGSLE